MAKENVLRSLLILAIELYFFYTTIVPIDPNLWNILSNLQNAIYVILMNMELIWRRARLRVQR
ncbi:hypothetical protein HDU98_006125 [Podochytrium sp. JEL0797]|nr:hypothetical protein HDU98_006125 [Podochytrium sp. JEL0797]